MAIGDRGFEPGAPRLIRSALLIAYAEAARASDIDPYRMLRRAGLPTAALDQPDVRVPADRVRLLIADSAVASGCEDFGLRVGQAFKLSMKGALGLLAREQPTVRKAIEVIAKYLRYQDDTVEIRLERQADTLLFMPELLTHEARNDRHSVEMTIAKYVQILRGLLGGDWMPLSVTFTHRAPRNPAPYVALFGDAAFEQVVNGIVLREADLNVPIPTADPDMALEIARYIERNAPRQGMSLSERVVELIDRLMPAGACTIDRISQHLGVDRRTVHRRLLQEGKTFTELVHNARLGIIAHQISLREQPLSVVANRLGFSSLSTFSRWFRQTYGVSASEYRVGAKD